MEVWVGRIVMRLYWRANNMALITKDDFPSRDPNGPTRQQIDEGVGAYWRDHMIKYGHATLYHTRDSELYRVTAGDSRKWFVTDVSSTLRFECLGQRKSWHNFGRERYDFWFVGPDNFICHGYQIGDMNTIAHCKRTKRRATWLDQNPL